MIAHRQRTEKELMLSYYRESDNIKSTSLKETNIPDEIPEKRKFVKCTI